MKRTFLLDTLAILLCGCTNGASQADLQAASTGVVTQTETVYISGNLYDVTIVTHTRNNRTWFIAPNEMQIKEIQR